MSPSPPALQGADVVRLREATELLARTLFPVPGPRPPSLAQAELRFMAARSEYEAAAGRAGTQPVLLVQGIPPRPSPDTAAASGQIVSIPSGLFDELTVRLRGMVEEADRQVRDARAANETATQELLETQKRLEEAEERRAEVRHLRLRVGLAQGEG